MNPGDPTNGESTADDDEPMPEGKILSRNYHDLLQEATAAGSWAGLEGRLEALMQSAVPPGQQLIGRAAFEAERRRFYTLVRAAGQPYRAAGWDVRTNSLVYHGAEGHWGHIVFRADGWQSPLPILISAGNLSPYLLRVFNRVDPAKPPPRFIASHISILWQMEIEYLEGATENPPPLDLSQRMYARSGIVLGKETAPGWLADALVRLVTLVRGLSSDLAMRDWILEHDASNYMSLRNAVLLTRHLGLTDEVPHLLELAERAKADSNAGLIAAGQTVPHEDRGTLYPQFWSHRRFLRFLQETEP